MLQTYDPMKVNITYNNRQLRMFGDSMFTLARDEDNVTLKKGVKGDSTYILNANKAGKLTITLQQDSPDVAFLEQCAERNVMANLAITDANDSGSMFFAQNVMVSKLPDRARAKEAADVTIIFLIPDIMLSN
ncbi:phage structural protein [Flavonifractor plautii]|jgi:hypothetical protein|uniref:phage structural protein n=1 Tax=Flavonifractor plautii TaxID=292800 RepID=UPI00189A0039|nr:phage protein [Flavonifractor plautii]MDB7873875.1 DUF3277 family protein [Flavonifractor plautii]DAJ88866.1 MAG TPA: Protein of unknown function (DUF3277) [Caudoviricetes sp.]DAY52151.1 MAG TPA: Protein of unknown function (DUF3277) [Caudoviricetes sp.]